MKRRRLEHNGTGVATLTPTTTEHEALVARLLADSKKAEALKWLERATDGERTIGMCKTSAKSRKLVCKLYELGAVEIIAAQIQPRQNGGGQHTGKLVIKLPNEGERRRALFEWCQEQGDSLGFSPDLDQGESHLFLLLD